ncbi:hypothetical protein F9C07_11140 [Aspergillus flavus]|uniref:Uncharacterized protein n=1 Tax=Aspergillus flavus (strain ATCC 200026 / FGSC A1120 / IAM 13836 / NRRL 3357 / JCM 12722 / SRRC 167) TaxID=332952 RepID=A0A7U2MSF7_ASPFN|nr:hypothetical protein F9C07_11140 [Aspergillus flavus]
MSHPDNQEQKQLHSRLQFAAICSITQLPKADIDTRALVHRFSQEAKRSLVIWMGSRYRVLWQALHSI